MNKMKHNRNAKKNKGFSLAEMMVVIAIILILALLAFIAVQSHLRSMQKLAYDDYAKEIFIVAQNHLSMAKTQNYLGRIGYGEPETDENDAKTGYYYYVVTGDNRNGNLNSQSDLLSLMLPPGSIDETIRKGDYIIRYQAETGTITHVFYWSDSGRFAHTYGNGDYDDFWNKRDDTAALKTYTDNSVIGYYGGADAAVLSLEQELAAPVIRIVNAERLIVTVTEQNDASITSDTGYTIKLTVRGDNGGVKTFTLNVTDPRVTSQTVDGKTVYTVVLDDITRDGFHFADITADTGAFVPGENVSVTATAMMTNKLSNIADSETLTANSLFGNSTDPDAGSAEISNIRHLENLSKGISKVNTDSSVAITSAFQGTDLDWNAFKSAIGDDSLSVYDANGNATAAGTFLPVTPGYALSYDGSNGGRSHSISNVMVTAGTGEAGLFGTLANSSVSNLKLLDFSVSGGNAGALAGTVNGTTVTNVVAFDSEGSSFATVNASGSAGGLVGKANDSDFIGSAASLCVNSTGGDAGGLIGTATGGSYVTACYSGGRTVNGAYRPTEMNVTGAGATGGLIGDADDTKITASYSTCSASGGTTGGLVGSSGGVVTDCYSTGLVRGTGSTGAFAGTMSGTASNCGYYEIINEIQITDGEYAGGYTYRSAVSTGAKDGVTPFDANADAYNAFLGPESGWASASPYDSRLNLYYSGSYPLPTVEQLLGSSAGELVAVHTGDWPSPELLVVNVGE